MDDSELLDEYATRGSQEAFAQIVRRYIDTVYASARRQLRDSHLADDVTQAVFMILARKADTVRRGALAGWLLKTTRYCASNARLAQARRKRHEQEAAAMIKPREQTEESIAQEMKPALDEAMDALREMDRSAGAMRYLAGKSLREVGSA